MAGGFRALVPAPSSKDSSVRVGYWHAKKVIDYLTTHVSKSLHRFILVDRNSKIYESADIRGYVPVQDGRSRDGDTSQVSVAATANGVAIQYGSETVPAGEIWYITPTGSVIDHDDGANARDLECGVDSGTNNDWIYPMLGTSQTTWVTAVTGGTPARVGATLGAGASPFTAQTEMPVVAGQRLSVKVPAAMANTKIATWRLNVRKVTL